MRLDLASIQSTLCASYGIHAVSVTPVKGGFSAKAFRIEDRNNAAYFLKVYDQSLPTTRPFVERIEAYMPALGFLAANPALKGRVLTPIPTLNGDYKAKTGGSVFVLFHYIHGETPGIEDITSPQTAELAETLAILHSARLPFATPDSDLAEDITLPFLGRLTRYLDELNAEDDALACIVRPQADLLRTAITEAVRLRDTVRLNFGPLVLCHGDAHGNNVIQSGRLVLVDWEGLHWAPAEADLFIYDWHPHGSVFLETYAAARNGFELNRELLRFYVLRRRLEDIWVDIQRLTEESSDETETAKLLDWVRRGIAEVERVMR